MTRGQSAAEPLTRPLQADLAKEAVVGDLRYIYPTGRTCGLLALLGYGTRGADLRLRRLEVYSTRSRSCLLWSMKVAMCVHILALHT